MVRNDALDNDLVLLNHEFENDMNEIRIDEIEEREIYIELNNNITRMNNDIRLDLTTSVLYGNLYKDFITDFNTIECKYFTEEDIINFMNSSRDEYLSCFSINVQSILSKFNNLTNFIDAINIDKSNVSILCMQEIWHSFDLNFLGYNYFKKNRVGTQGGGVGILVKNGISAVVINDDRFFVSNLYECITLEIIINEQKYLITSVYRPPSTPGISRHTAIENFLNKFDEHMEFLEGFNLPIIFCSDTNIDLFKVNNLNSEASNFFQYLTSNGLINNITKATRIAGNSFSLIDIMATKNLVHTIEMGGVCTSPISDHFMLFNIFRLTKKTKVKPPNTFTRRSFSKNNLERFRTELAVTDWREVINEKESVDNAYSIFITKFLNIFNKNIPKSTIRLNRRTMPIQQHMTKVLLKSRLKKRALFTRKEIERNIENEESFRRFRNNFNRSCRKAKKIHVRKRLIEANGNSKKLWQVLKDTMGVGKKDVKIEFIEHNNDKIYEPILIANAFNEHFSKIGPNLTKFIPKITSKSFQDYLPPPAESTFFMRPLSENAVLEVISNMKHKKSQDDNELSIFLINFVRITIIKPLTHILNLSFATGKMPEQMKITRTICIHKSGSFFLLDNFRGVSLINSFSKIQEKCIYNNLLDFLDSKHYFNKFQYGFRPGRSTFHAILHLTNKITQALASGRVAMAILLDVRKCFDMLDRSVLLKKLENLGVRGHALEWFRSYFENRRQRVFFKGVNSATLEDILWGVLQGSILGVLLFPIYVNDIHSCSDTLLSYLFADDNCGFLEAENLQELIRIANEELPKLLKWYSTNKLLLHGKKTKVLIFGMARNDRFINEQDLGLLQRFPVYIDLNNEGETNQEKINKLNLIPNEAEKSVRHLGVLIDHKLTFKFHFEQLYTRANKIIFSLKIMKNLLNKRHLTLLYSAYLKSILEYCCSIFAGAPRSYLVPLIKLQKKAVRIIMKSSSFEHTAEFFKELRILPLDKMIIFNVARFMFDYRNNNVPSTLYDTWQRNREVQERELRNSEDFYINITNRSYIKNLPLYKFPAIWNALSQELKVIECKKEFSRKLFKELLNSIEF